VNIETQQFGSLEYEESALLTFPAGILGFEHLTRFLLIDQDEVAPLRWFQPVDDPNLAFTVIDPLLFFPDYRVTLTGEDRQALQIPKGTDPLVLSLVTIPEDPSAMTANLLGPLVVNPATRLGKQLVLHDSGYPVRARLISDETADTQASAVPV
jgi:flagellar assembly factor FliW